MFCGHVTKSLGQNEKEHLGSCEVDSAEDNIHDAAQILGDNEMLAKISGVDLKAKEAQYHHSCRKNYLSKAAYKKSKEKNVTSERKIRHENAFTKLQEYINKCIIHCTGAMFLKDLHALYLDWLEEVSSTYTSQTLCDKILLAFPGKISKHTISKKTGVILFHSDLDTEVAVKKAINDSAAKECALQL